MKFLFLTSNHLQGASEALWVRSAIELAVRGHQIKAITPWAPSKTYNPYGALLEEAGIHYKSTATINKLVSFVWRRAAGLRRKYLIEQIKSEHADLIILCNGDWQDGLDLIESVKESGVPFVTLDHGIFEISWPASGAIERLFASYPCAARNYFVSRSSMELARRQLGHELPHARVVRNPYKVRYDVEQQWPASCGEARMASVGRLAPRTKGQDIAIQVLAGEHWRNRPLKLSFVGGIGSEAPLARLARNLNVHNVEFSGWRDDIEQVWREHELLVMPSRAENMPLTLVEAMLCGRPSVVTDVGGNAELVEHGVNGFIAESATVASFGRALEEAWQARGRWQEMGASAARRIRTLIPAHPEKDFADELTEVVQQVTSQRK